MEKLEKMQCVPCRGGEPAVGEPQIARLLPQIPEWSLCEKQGIKRLEREFEFKNFAQALAFSNKVGALAEQEDHHPAILTEWGKVTVTWWTHILNGLHLNDFIMAAKTDRLYDPEE
jgi:4a-hydroxytetrahydrobiopterin dehydratase